LRGGKREDRRLCEPQNVPRSALIDADLRAGLIKQRIPRKGQAPRRLSRIRAYRSGQRCGLPLWFPKSERDNIGDDELAHWRKVATSYLQVSPKSSKS